MCVCVSARRKHLLVSIATSSHLSTLLRRISIHLAQGPTVIDVVSLWCRRQSHSSTRKCLYLFLKFPFFFDQGFFFSDLLTLNTSEFCHFWKLQHRLFWLTQWLTGCKSLKLTDGCWRSLKNIFYILRRSIRKLCWSFMVTRQHRKKKKNHDS